MKVVILSLLVCFTTLQIKAQGNKAPSKPVQPTMHQIFAHMKALLPFMVDEKKFNDSTNAKVISEHLKQMRVLIKDAKHSTDLDSPTFKISRKALESHVGEIEGIFRGGNKNYARWQLNSTVPLCMSCHTQSPSASRHWKMDDLMKDLRDDFQKAELLFMGRDFDGSLGFYDKVIDGFPKNNLDVQQVERALERKVVVFSRVKRDFKAGEKSLEKSKKNKNLPEFLKKNIDAWIALFKIQERNGFPNPKTADDKQIRQYVERELKSGLWDDMVEASNPRLVKNLTVSGVLYEYLNTHPQSKIKPEILYWLALCDEQLRENLFYSLSDLYLKECMNEYSANPIAKKCFDQYKENTILSYSGSGGVFLPDDVKKELKNLSLKVYGEDRSQVTE